MFLYLLRRNEPDYDEYDAHLVRAANEHDARLIASFGAKMTNEDPKEWLDAAKSTCVLVTPEGIEEVILSSFNAG